ncbi:pseudouridine synthase [Nonomuraea sediminis]|uniref:pseudouridine synthase n=1 Tax=Nonomuraea sediminis TaxID=2835864 RepID=UPI0027DFFF6C|nr:pseudouridine synthase [Nonomuraea sediminis]
MINRRSTPSGDGRGRGRATGSGSRGGRPAFRSDDTRGSFRADSRGARRNDDSPRAPRSDDSRGSFRADRRDDSRGSFRPRSDDSRGSFRAERRDDDSRNRDDVRSRDDFRGGRRDDDSRGGSRARYGGPAPRDRSRGDRPSDRGYSRDRDDRGDRGFSRDRNDRGDRGFGRDRGDDRGGNRDRDDRGGSRDRGYTQNRGTGRDDRGFGGGRDDRGNRGFSRDRGDDRGNRGFSQGRDDRGDRGFGGGRDDRGNRGFGRDRADDRGNRTDDRGNRGYGRDRGFERDGRGSASERPARGPETTRARYGKRADGPAGGRDTGSVRASRTGRRDDVQTIGGNRSPQKPQNPFKTAKQPIRDRNFYEPGYTDERDTTEVPDGVRLQKVLAQAGVASRRACEEMIGDGRVTVNGQVVRRFGAKVDPAKQVIHVDGKRIPTAPDLVYYALNKPIGVVSTMDDPQGRPCLADFVQELAPRLFHVGRLDTETEGLLLLTNDGELANRLTHPSYGVQKKYWAKVPGPIPRDLGRRLKQGIELEDGLARADDFSIVQEHGQQALVEVVLHEGRKHVVRRMLEEAGHRVIDLARIEFGPVKLGRTKPGTVRALSLKEVGDLYAAVKL